MPGYKTIVLRSDLFDILNESDGKDTVTIYCVAEKQRIALPPSQCVKVSRCV